MPTLALVPRSRESLVYGVKNFSIRESHGDDSPGGDEMTAFVFRKRRPSVKFWFAGWSDTWRSTNRLPQWLPSRDKARKARKRLKLSFYVQEIGTYLTPLDIPTSSSCQRWVGYVIQVSDVQWELCQDSSGRLPMVNYIWPCWLSLFPYPCKICLSCLCYNACTWEKGGKELYLVSHGDYHLTTRWINISKWDDRLKGVS